MVTLPSRVWIGVSRVRSGGFPQNSMYMFLCMDGRRRRLGRLEDLEGELRNRTIYISRVNTTLSDSWRQPLIYLS
jgi:hypothetical protein